MSHGGKRLINTAQYSCEALRRQCRIADGFPSGKGCAGGASGPWGGQHADDDVLRLTVDEIHTRNSRANLTLLVRGWVHAAALWLYTPSASSSDGGLASHTEIRPPMGRVDAATFAQPKDTCARREQDDV